MTETNPSWMAKVEEMAQEVARREGCFLYDIEFVGIGKGRTLRLYIDKDETPSAGLVPDPLKEGEEPKGVGIDDCSNVSKALNVLLDETDLIPGDAYTMEVSTPGVDRWLRKGWHFERAIGKKIWVKTQKALEAYGVTDKKWKAAKQIEDVLMAFDGENLSFRAKDVDLKIPLSAIEKSKIVFELNKGQKK